MPPKQEPSAAQQEVSNCLTRQGAYQRRAGGLLAARLREKGWSIRDAADYLGVSRQRLYSVFEDPGRARLWDCAVAGIPQCTQEISQELKALRKNRVKPPRTHFNAPEFEIGDEVMATRYAGIADEGEAGLIAGLRGQNAELEILVRMPDGEDWFPKADFHDYFATTGLNASQKETR